MGQFISLEDQGFYKPWEFLGQSIGAYQERKRQKRLDEQAAKDAEVRRRWIEAQIGNLDFSRQKAERDASFTPRVHREGEHTFFQLSPTEWEIQKPNTSSRPTVAIEQVPVPGGEPIFAEVAKDAAGNVVGITPINVTRSNENKPLGDEALNKFNAANFALNQLPDLERAVTSSGHAGGPVMGRLRKLWSNIAGPNKHQLEFENLAARTLSPIAKGVLGETGVLSDQDIARITPLLPQYTDTAEVRQMKLDKLKEMLGSQVSRWLDMMDAAGRNTDSLRQVIQPSIDAAKPGTGIPNAVRISSAEEYANLPAGTPYIDASGKTRIKQ